LFIAVGLITRVPFERLEHGYAEKIISDHKEVASQILFFTFRL
jgi:hypothetical protein